MNKPGMVTGYVTKYALTYGIIPLQGYLWQGARLVTVLQGRPCFFHGKDFWLSKRLAIKYAQHIKAKKIKALQKLFRETDDAEYREWLQQQIRRFESLNFEE